MFRWFAMATLVGCLSISIYHRHRAREEGETIPRGREGTLLVLGRVVVGLPLWGAVLAYLVNPRWMQWASFALPEGLRWVGVGLGFLSIPAAYWVFSSLGRNVSETVLTKEHHELVTQGAYRWIRHPLYTMGITLMLAIGLMSANWFILFVGVVALVCIRIVVIPAEEQALLATFGDRYTQYMERTGRMVPRIPRRG